VVNDVLQSFNCVKIEDAILLGAPLFPGPALDRAWKKRCDDLARAVGRLSAINSQDALILLRSSFSAPKVLHLLRCSPTDLFSQYIKVLTNKPMNAHTLRLLLRTVKRIKQN